MSRIQFMCCLLVLPHSDLSFKLIFSNNNRMMIKLDYFLRIVLLRTEMKMKGTMLKLGIWQRLAVYVDLCRL